MHALVSVASRLVVMNFGQSLGGRRSARGDGECRGCGKCIWASRYHDPAANAQFVGLLRRLPGPVRYQRHGRAGRDGRHHRRQWRRQDHVSARGRGRADDPQRTWCGSTAGDRPLVPRTISSGSGSRWRRKGRRLFPEPVGGGKPAARRLLQASRPVESERVYGLFPELANCVACPATDLSGGQQQMTAVGRALMSNPRLLLCDELSLGLAPVVIRDIYDCLGRSRPKARRSSLSSRTSTARSTLRRVLLLSGRPLALTAPTKGFDRAAISAAISASRAGAAMEWLNMMIQGTLLGGIYALFAIGLSLSFGIMRLVNIAHGDLIVLSAYVALVVGQGTGLDPISCLVIVVPVMFAARLRVAARPVELDARAADLLPPLLVSFGISIIIQNGLLQGLRRLHRTAPGRRDRDREPATSRRHHDRRLSAGGLRRGAARARQFAAAVLSNRPRPRLSRRVGRCRYRRADGRRQPQSLRASPSASR